MHAPSPIAWVIIIVLVLLLFAAPKLPKLARSLGESMRIFKSEMKQMGDESKSGRPEQDSDASEDEDKDATDTPLKGDIVDHKRQQGPRA